MPLSLSIVAPELGAIKDELHMDNPLEAVLTYCLRPLILGPLSEIFERATILHSGNSLYRNSFLRPLQLLIVQPIVQILAIFHTYLYGLVYLVLSTCTTLWEEKYYQPVGPASLNYLALGIGYSFGSQVCRFLADPIYRALKKKHGENDKAEFRVVLMFPASILTPVGMPWYGWGAQAVMHWIVPDLGTGLFAGAAMILLQCTGAYMYEAFTLYAASATGAVCILRGLTVLDFLLSVRMGDNDACSC